MSGASLSLGLSLERACASLDKSVCFVFHKTGGKLIKMLRKLLFFAQFNTNGDSRRVGDLSGRDP